jgi:hypothetical protein
MRGDCSRASTNGELVLYRVHAERQQHSAMPLPRECRLTLLFHCNLTGPFGRAIFPPRRILNIETTTPYGSVVARLSIALMAGLAGMGRSLQWLSGLMLWGRSLSRRSSSPFFRGEPTSRAASAQLSSHSLESHDQ